MLTDGQDSKKEAVHEIIKQYCDDDQFNEDQDFRIFAFGIGDCDKHLVEQAAELGNGSAFFVEFDKLDDLKG